MTQTSDGIASNELYARANWNWDGDIHGVWWNDAWSEKVPLFNEEGEEAGWPEGQDGWCLVDQLYAIHLGLTNMPGATKKPKLRTWKIT